MSGFWHGFVVVLTVASMAGCLWLLFGNARGTPGEDTGHVWDDDLTERNNPLPRWWLNLFVITVIFSAGYLALYPGLGNFAGSLGWSQEAQARAGLDGIAARRAQRYAAFAGKDVEALSHDTVALAMGREVFQKNCAGCHGADARGAIGFPNLADRDWLHGSRPADLIESITQGRRGQMPPFNGALSPERVKALVDFIPRWSDPTLSASTRAEGLHQFAQTCAACHGADGHGNAALGAPDLTDSTWLWGGSPDAVRETILFGRTSTMPAHAELLSTDDIRLVAAYVHALSDVAN